MAREYNSNQPDPQGIGDMQAAIAAGAALGDPRSPVAEPGAGVFTLVPASYRVENLENYLPRPLRIEQSVLLHDTDSFIAYVNGFKLPGPSRIFFDGPQEQFMAVLDYHETETPAWCEHTATFKPRRSVVFSPPVCFCNPVAIATGFTALARMPSLAPLAAVRSRRVDHCQPRGRSGRHDCRRRRRWTPKAPGLCES